MFCKNCGNQIPDGVAFCNACGAPAAAPAQAPVDGDATVRVRVQPPVQEVPVQQPVYQAPVQEPVYQAPVQPVQEPVYQAPVQEAYQAPVQPVYQAPVDQYGAPQYGAPAPQKSNGKMIGIIVAAVAAIAAVVVVLVLVLGGGSSGGSANPEDVAKDYIVAQLEYDAEDLVDCMSDLTLKQASKNLGYDEINRDAVLENLKKTIPTNVEKRDYEIVGTERDDSLDKDAELRGIAQMFGQEAADSISDMCIVRVTLKVDGEETTRSVTCVKEGSGWKVAG